MFLGTINLKPLRPSQYLSFSFKNLSFLTNVCCLPYQQRNIIPNTGILFSVELIFSSPLQNIKPSIKNCWCLIEENSELVKASFMQLLSLLVIMSENHFPGFEKCSKLVLALSLYLLLFYNYVAAMQVPPNKPKAINLFWMTFWTECKNQVLR